MNGTALGRPPRWRHRGRRPQFISAGYANYGPGEGWVPYEVVQAQPTEPAKPDPRIAKAEAAAENASRVAAQAAKSARTFKWVAAGAAAVALFALGRSGK